MANPTMTGIWRGEVRGFRYGIEVEQLGDHVVGLLHVGGFERTGSLSGACHYPAVSLAGFFVKHGGHFSGRFVDENTITGTLKYQEDSAQFTLKRAHDGKWR
jgi:hypothetical protein